MKKYILCLSIIICVLVSGCQNNSANTSISDKSNSLDVSDAPNSTSDTVNEDATPHESANLDENEENELQENPHLTDKERENTDFRNAKWGDSSATVLEYETEIELTQLSDGDIAGSATVNGFDSYVFYSFDNDKLYEAMYYFVDLFSNPGQYIQAYYSLKDTLIEIYGDPIEDTIIPMETQSLIENAGESRALEFGYVAYRARWETDTTKILIGMSAQNYEVNLIIAYTDKNYEDDVKDSGL